MSKRLRHWAMIGASALVGAAVAVSSRAFGWSDMAFYAVGGAAVIVLVAVGVPWVELARDGVSRRAPRERRG